MRSRMMATTPPTGRLIQKPIKSALKNRQSDVPTPAPANIFSQCPAKYGSNGKAKLTNCKFFSFGSSDTIMSQHLRPTSMPSRTMKYVSFCFLKNINLGIDLVIAP